MLQQRLSALDREWVEAVRAGDRRAFSELYRAHAPSVRAAAAAYVHDRESVDDVVQETFTRALHQLDTLRDPQQFRPWLYAIARHCAIDVQRQRQREAPWDVEVATHDRPSVTLGPDELAELDELTRLVNGSVVGLSSRDATAVVMMTGLGFSSSDVGSVLGVSPGAAKVIAYRARVRLRQSLALQLLVRIQGGHCETFRRLFEGDDVLEAARHTETCATCRESAEAEISLYALQPDDPNALGTESVHEGVGHGLGSPLDEPES